MNLPVEHPDILPRLFELQRSQSRFRVSVPWSVRADRLRRLRRLIVENRVALADAISDDFGQRSRHETELLEMTPVLEGIAYSLRHGRRWMRQGKRPAGLLYWPGKASLMPQPLGVVGIVVPWNYPLNLSLSPANSALAAGNRVMIKPSELTPRFGALLATLASRHFSEDELAIVNGGVDVSRRFCQLPFDHLLFTGSTAVGHQVMRAASDNLTPVTLELGGKSPAIIGPSTVSDKEWRALVRRLMIGKTFNAGQTCVAPDHVFVPRAHVERFIDAARHAVSGFYPDLAATRDYTSIISDRHYARLAAMVEEARAGGAAVWPLADTPPDPRRRLFPPVALTELPAGCAALREEIFGPVLPVIAYDRLDEVLAAIHAGPRPLALYVFERDGQLADRVLASTVSGGATVNDVLLHVGPDSLPFGGVGASGMGAYHGETGFHTFSHARPVFRRGLFSTLPWLYPPYGRFADKLLRLLRRAP